MRHLETRTPGVYYKVNNSNISENFKYQKAISLNKLNHRLILQAKSLVNLSQSFYLHFEFDLVKLFMLLIIMLLGKHWPRSKEHLSN
jgi:hypothetical protein